MTRWKLSDHDEWALYRLASHVSTDEARPALCSVVVHDGWGIATDSYRLLALPLDCERTGTVSALDAAAGGTVDLASLLDQHGSQWLPHEAKLPTPAEVDAGRLYPSNIDLLVRLARKRWVKFNPGIGQVEPAVTWWGRDYRTGRYSPTPEGVLVLPDGTRLPAGSLVRGAMQPRHLADAAVAVSDAYGGHGVSLLGDGARVVAVLGPEGEWADGWALCMGMRPDKLPIPEWVPADPHDRPRRPLPPDVAEAVQR